MQGYEEMMRKIKSKAVICYGEPFEEMKGKIIVVDYAQNNNYKKHYTLQTEENLISQNIFDVCNKRAFGYVDIEKGRGSAGGGSSGGSNSSPKQSSQIIQRKKMTFPQTQKILITNMIKQVGKVLDRIRHREQKPAANGITSHLNYHRQTTMENP